MSCQRLAWIEYDISAALDFRSPGLFVGDIHSYFWIVSPEHLLLDLSQDAWVVRNDHAHSDGSGCGLWEKRSTSIEAMSASHYLWSVVALMRLCDR